MPGTSYSLAITRARRRRLKESDRASDPLIGWPRPPQAGALAAPVDGTCWRSPRRRRRSRASTWLRGLSSGAPDRGPRRRFAVYGCVPTPWPMGDSATARLAVDRWPPTPMFLFVTLIEHQGITGAAAPLEGTFDRHSHSFRPIGHLLARLRSHPPSSGGCHRALLGRPDNVLCTK